MVSLTYQTSEVAKTDTENATAGFRDLSNDQIMSLVRLLKQAPTVFDIVLKLEFYGRGFKNEDVA